MTDDPLKPPARFGHGLLLGLTATIAFALASAIGQRLTLVVAVATIALFLGGYWAFSRDGWVVWAGGTFAALLGILGLLATTALVLVQSMRAPSGAGSILAIAVTLALIGSVIAVLVGVVPGRVTAQEGPVAAALLYGAGITTGLALLFSTVQLGVARLFGTSLDASGAAATSLLLDVAAVNPLARFGILSMLAGGSLWYAARLARLPLGRRLTQGIVIRVETWRDTDRADEPVGPRGADPPTLAGLLGLGDRWARTPAVVGGGAVAIGFVATVIGLTPETQTLATTHPVARTLGATLGGSTGLHRQFVSIALWLVGLRVVMAIAWRGTTIDWTAHGRRLGYVNGTVAVVLAAALASGWLLDALLATPPLQFVPMLGGEPALAAGASGLRHAGLETLTASFQHRPDRFAPWIGGLRALVGAPVLGIVLLAALLDLGVLLLLVSALAGSSTRLTRPAAGPGLLFVAAVGGSILGVNAPLAFAAGAGALLAWELHSLGADLARQLDPGASTLRGELVHLVASLAVIGVVLVVTLVGARAVRSVPSPAAPWQSFGALALALLALFIGVLYLGFRGDTAPASDDSV